MNEVPGSADDRLLALFFLSWRSFALEADRVLAQQRLGRVHHRVLYTLARAPEVSVGDLAIGLGISRQALHRPLAELIERGLVTSCVSAQNRRERLLRVTGKGKRIEQRASGAQQRLLGAAFERLGPPAMSGWVKVMLALAEPSATRAPPLLAAGISAGMQELLAAAEQDTALRPVHVARRKRAPPRGHR